MPSDPKDSYHNPNLSLSIEDRIRTIISDLRDDPTYDGWDTTPLKHAKFVSAIPGESVWEMTVTPTLCNKGGNLHGGAACTIMDTLTSTVFLTIAKEGFMDQGTVSRTITMTYLRPVPAGTKVRIVSKAVAAGKRLAHCTGQIETIDGKPDYETNTMEVGCIVTSLRTMSSADSQLTIDHTDTSSHSSPGGDASFDVSSRSLKEDYLAGPNLKGDYGLLPQTIKAAARNCCSADSNSNEMPYRTLRHWFLFRGPWAWQANTGTGRSEICM